MKVNAGKALTTLWLSGSDGLPPCSNPINSNKTIRYLLYKRTSVKEFQVSNLDLCVDRTISPGIGGSRVMRIKMGV